MDIAEVAKISGLPPSTLRFYEEKGLIPSIGRNSGFSLDEIGEMVTPERLEIDRSILLAKAEELDSKIKESTAMRDGLSHTAVCKAPNHFECPKFLRLLRVAGKNRFRQGSKLKGKG